MASASSSIPPLSSLSSTHLSYPTFEPESSAASSSTSHSRPRELLKDRLYVGNLHPTVDEHTLIQIFSKFGKLARLDFLFHKAGPMKGKPRGFAFIEYSDPSDADRALASANGKPLRGRHIVVTYAHQAPLDQAGVGVPTHAYRRNVNEAGRPTALSMLKSAGGRDRTKDKIALMEAKLRQLEQSPDVPQGTTPRAQRPRPLSHSSLPTKPLPQTAVAPPLFPVKPQASPSLTPGSSASPLMRAPTRPAPALDLGLGMGSGVGGTKKSGGVTNMKGVKIVKKKAKDKGPQDGQVKGKEA